MFKVYNTFSLLILASFAFSCSSEKGETSDSDDKSKKTKEAPKTLHASDWEPTDPKLVNGKAIYKQECAGCHDEGEEGAPILGKAAEWDKREAKGLETLLDHAINGFLGKDGEMPARGGTESLTDEEVTNAVNFILATSRK